ncbi:MAG: alpha-L-fucosidase [Oscillospiraceae bacterium]|nr:alpha-L-fucosidase [Oscillospiraceae bacterium]
MHPHKQDWFNESKLCMFIHYGLYSQIGRGEWTQFYDKMPHEEVEALARTFDPKNFDAEELVLLAKNAGFRYACLTSRHHEGFCLFDSKVSDFTSVKYMGRDLLREFVEACRKHDMKVAVYYSLLDWRYKGYFDYQKHPESKASMVQQAFDQVREILTNYGKIDYLWFDGGWYEGVPGGAIRGKLLSEFWDSPRLLEMIYSLQPDILVNDRTGEPGDVTTPEQQTGASGDERYSEACMTIGDRQGWGFIQNNNLRPFPFILQNIIVQLSFGGNFNLNIGPMADGSLRDGERQLLTQLGSWMEKNSESVYGTGRAPAGVISVMGEFTTKGNDLYWHIFRWPHRGEAILSGLRKKVTRVTLLASGKEYPFEQQAYGRLIVKDIPLLAPDAVDTVFKIECTDEPTPADPGTYGIL